MPAAEPLLWREPTALRTAERARRGRVLLELARRTLESGLGDADPRTAPGSSLTTPRDGNEPWLLEHGAAFVSLHLGAALRGCVGSVEPVRPLVDDVRMNAHRAAFEDPRFTPLGHDELAAVSLEVSLLGPLEALASTTFEDVAAELRPGVDGVLLAARGYRATLLPQVWRSFPDPLDFVAALERKAGLAGFSAASGPRLRFYRYRVEAWHE